MSTTRFERNVVALATLLSAVPAHGERTERSVKLSMMEMR